jgi:hypothetical protein
LFLAISATTFFTDVSEASAWFSFNDCCHPLRKALKKPTARVANFNFEFGILFAILFTPYAVVTC